jgi:hypothetical protein
MSLRSFSFKGENMPKGIQAQRQSHLERQELLRQNRMAAGLIAERFPGISQIVFRLTYYQRGPHPVLMIRTVNFVPTDYAYFHLDCLRAGCTNGGFDMLPIVAGLVKEQKKVVKGKLCCDGKIGALTHHHASIAYEVSIQTAKSLK